MKTCTKCGETKPLEAFSRKAAAADGRHPHCRDCCAEYKRRYYDTHRSEVIQRVADWRIRNPEKVRETARRRDRRAYAANYMRKRRTRALGLPAVPYNRVEIFERDGWTCRLCGGAVDPDAQRRGDGASIDHIIPISDADCPGDVPWNVQLAHHRCNAAKNNRAVGSQLLIPLEEATEGSATG